MLTKCQEDDDEVEWEIEGDFERNAFDFIVDDKHNGCKKKIPCLKFFR